VVELVNLILQLFLYLCDRIGHSPSPKKEFAGEDSIMEPMPPPR
jgi:hypothetical protein